MCSLEKCWSFRLKEDFPNSVETFLLNGGLYHMIFLLCLLWLSSLVLVGLSVVSFLLCRDSCKFSL